MECQLGMLKSGEYSSLFFSLLPITRNEKLEHLNGSYMAVIWLLRTWPGNVQQPAEQHLNGLAPATVSCICKENHKWCIFLIVVWCMSSSVRCDGAVAGGGTVIDLLVRI